jgi:hypothetical protein
MKDQLDVTCYFISLIMRSTCFGHQYIHLQELVTVLMSCHIGRLVLSSLCVGAFGAAGLLVVFVLQAEACKTNTTIYQPQLKLQHTTN